MRSIEMTVTTTPTKSDIIRTKNVHLENKAAINSVSIYVGWSETEQAAGLDTDFKELKVGEMIFFSSEKKQILRVWAKTLSGTATLSITGSDGSINKPAADASRLAWYDRNPVSVIKWWGMQDVAPHFSTQRWTYTVPTSKKAYIENVNAMAVRTVVATTVGRVCDYVVYYPSGGGSLWLTEAEFIKNAVGDSDKNNIACPITMLVGDTVTGFTSDDSTAGTVDHFLMAKITEFDV